MIWILPLGQLGLCLIISSLSFFSHPRYFLVPYSGSLPTPFAFVFVSMLLIELEYSCNCDTLLLGHGIDTSYFG